MTPKAPNVAWIDRRPIAAPTPMTTGGKSRRVFRENDTSAFKQRTITLPSGERVRRVVRPQFRAMLKHLTDGQAQVMVAYDLDRAVRDPRDLEDLIDVKVLGGFAVRSVTGSLRLDTDPDVAMAGVLVAMANKSSADTARRIARAAKQQAIEGAWHGGRVPFGYRAEAGALVIDPVTEPLVVEMYQRVLAGDSLYRIRKDWNARCILTTHGCAWSDRTLKMVLYNPSNKGVREYRPVLPDGSRARTSGRDLAARVGLAATLDQDRERLARLDDDYYDGLIDKAMWVRQRARIAEWIEVTRREYNAITPAHAGLSIDFTTVAAEWEGRTPMWQYQAASLILQAVLVHAHPADMMTAVPKRRNESTEDFHARRDAHRAAVLARRVKFLWRA